MNRSPATNGRAVDRVRRAAYPPSGHARALMAAVPMWSTAVVGSSSTGAESRASSTAVGRQAPGVSSAVPPWDVGRSHGPEVERDAGHRADGVVRALERLHPAHPHPAVGHLQLVVDADRPLLEGVPVTTVLLIARVAVDGCRRT